MKSEIPEVLDTDLMFGTDKHMPTEKDIPKEFFEESSKWNTLFDKMFYHHDMKDVEMFPKAGVDPVKAMRLVKAHMMSYGTKHEHKRAGCAYMMSQYFDDWTNNKKP
jgi:hypothetical protein